MALSVKSVQSDYELIHTPFLSPMESAHTQLPKAEAIELENLNVYILKQSRSMKYVEKVENVAWDFCFGGVTFIMFENGLWVVEKDGKILFFDGLERL